MLRISRPHRFRRVGPALFRPSAINASLEGERTEIQSLRKVGDAHCFTPIGNQIRLPRIAHLLFPRCPTAVAWLIIAICVYAIQRRFVGSLAHIGQEVLELSPSLANLNPAPAIMAISVIVGIVAALLHMVPRPIGPAGPALARIVAVPRFPETHRTKLGAKAAPAACNAARRGSGYRATALEAATRPSGLLHGRFYRRFSPFMQEQKVIP